mmetsp:Transcript_23120/g.68710  ORF Transcript_23120/g.68710 Transcript_23120/m.68710 type:complete len:107 (+) Transcript_23120:209-529(+)
MLAKAILAPVLTALRNALQAEGTNRPAATLRMVMHLLHLCHVAAPGSRSFPSLRLAVTHARHLPLQQQGLFTTRLQAVCVNMRLQLAHQAKLERPAMLACLPRRLT